jgi:hypothetical protein
LTWKTPKPSCGMVWPLLSVMSGIAVTTESLLGCFSGWQKMFFPQPCPFLAGLHNPVARFFWPARSTW